METTLKTTPLIIATKFYNLDIIKQIINMGANINFSTQQGFTPLHMAIYNQSNDKIDIINYLLDKGADYNAMSSLGLSPIHCAIGINDLETVKILKNKGATVSPTKLQLDGYELARDRGYKEILELFDKKTNNNPNEKYDNCYYKIKITNVNINIKDYVINILNSYLINGILSFNYSENSLLIDYKSPYVIGEITSILTNLENKYLKLKRISNIDKNIDLSYELIIK